MKDEKPLVWLVNGTPEEEEFVKEALKEEFHVTPVRSVSSVRHQLKRLIKQNSIYGAVCCLDADGHTEQRKAWFSAKYLWRMGIPVVCYSLEKYDEKQWKRLKQRFPELNSEQSLQGKRPFTGVPYFVLSYEEDQADFILSALINQTVEKEKKKSRKEKKKSATI